MAMAPCAQPNRRTFLTASTLATAVTASSGLTNFLSSHAPKAEAQSAEGTGFFGGSSTGSANNLGSGLRNGLIVTDLEVVTVTDTTATFSWASFRGPHPSYGTLAPTVPTTGEVLLAPAGTRAPLKLVKASPVARGYHLFTVTGLKPGTTYRFQCRSNGIAATPGLIATNQTWSPERRGTFTTLKKPAGKHIVTIAIINDVHIGEDRHGILFADFPTPITQVPGGKPFPELMLQGALAEIKARGITKVFGNGDTTSEARPKEVSRFIEIMNTFGKHGTDWFVTRGNHDRPHTPKSDPNAGYGSFPVLPGTRDHRDPWGTALVPRQQMWSTHVGELRIIGIDSSHLDQSGGVIETGQFAQIERELASDPHRPTLMLAHHPVTQEAANTNLSGPIFTLNAAHSRRLQAAMAKAPGVFMMAAGHTHRVRRTKPDAAKKVDFVELGASAGYPGGYTLLHLYTGGYMVNFHRTSSPEALAWTARARWAGYGFNPEYTLGTLGHRSYTVARDLRGLIG